MAGFAAALVGTLVLSCSAQRERVPEEGGGELAADSGAGVDSGGGGSDTAMEPSPSWDDVDAVFAKRCLGCHSTTTTRGPRGGLALDLDACAALVGVPASNPTYDGALRVEPGESAASVLWHKVAATGEFGGEMPPEDRLSASTAGKVAAWIDAGARCGD